LKNNCHHHSFKTRPDPAGRPETRPNRGWNRAGLKKKQGKEKPGVTRRPDKTRSKTWLQPVDFCFFFFLLKRRCFNFKKIDLMKTRNPDLGSRSKNYSHHTSKYPRNMVFMNKTVINQNISFDWFQRELQ
jgi:hypothetical protein